MWSYPNDDNLLKSFSKYSKIGGFIFIVLGLLGIFFPSFMSIATVLFIGWLMVFSGFLAGYFTWITDKEEWLGWLKAFVLIVVGLFLVFYPMHGIAAVGLLLAIYLLLDAFTSISIAFTMRPLKGWWLWLLNSVLSLVLAAIFLVGWPFSSVWLVGLFIGISLFFDGFALLMMGTFFKKIDDGDI